MYPTLQIGSLSIQTYPLTLLLAGWAALVVGARYATRRGIDGDHIYNAGLYGFLAGIIASRLGHVITYWSAYRAQPLEIIGLNTGAFLVWPGVAGAVLVAAWYIARHRLPWARVMDAIAPGMLIALAIASVGALLAGRAFGRESDLPWAIMVWGVRRHPAQLYEALATAIVLGVLLLVDWGHPQLGRKAQVALFGYGMTRWLLEPFRADSRVIQFGLRVPQLFGLGAMLIALFLLLRSTRPASEGHEWPVTGAQPPG